MTDAVEYFWCHLLEMEILVSIARNVEMDDWTRGGSTNVPVIVSNHIGNGRSLNLP